MTKYLPDTTDRTVATYVLQRHTGKLRYVREWKHWLHWEQTHWAQSDTAAYQLVVESATALRKYADERLKEKKAEGKDLKWYAKQLDGVVSLLNDAKVNSVLASLRRMPGVEVSATELDQFATYLPLLNGTYELDTNTFRESRQDDLFTKVMPVAYDATATSADWDAFITDVVCGDMELAAYLQAAAGYTLSGLVGEQCMFFLHGQGANGKSTLVETLMAVMGPFAGIVSNSLVAAQRNDAADWDIADLQGLRLAVASETDQRHPMSEASIKRLASSEPLKGAKKHQDAFTFAPTHKLWMTGNHKPDVRGTDPGFWRRMRLIPFNANHEANPDRTLKSRLVSNLPAVLNWAIAGYKTFQAAGALNTPGSIQKGTKEYREESDIIGTFLNEECDVKPEEVHSAGDLYRAYVIWAKGMGHPTVSSTSFGRTLTSRGIEKKRTNLGNSYLGITVKRSVYQQPVEAF